MTSRYKHLPIITRKRIAELQATGHVVWVRKRLKVVCVDGGSYYRLRES